VTLVYPRKLVLTSPTGGGRSVGIVRVRTKATEFTTLHNILKNASLHLQENYELIAGARIENVHLYYDFITVAAIGDAHHIKIILNIHLKTANPNFVLYKILALPTRIFNDTFVQYLPEFLFFRH